MLLYFLYLKLKTCVGSIDKLPVNFTTLQKNVYKNTFYQPYILTNLLKLQIHAYKITNFPESPLIRFCLNYNFEYLT